MGRREPLALGDAPTESVCERVGCCEADREAGRDRVPLGDSDAVAVGGLALPVGVVEAPRDGCWLALVVELPLRLGACEAVALELRLDDGVETCEGEEPTLRAWLSVPR